MGAPTDGPDDEKPAPDRLDDPMKRLISFVRSFFTKKLPVIWLYSSHLYAGLEAGCHVYIVKYASSRGETKLKTFRFPSTNKRPGERPLAKLVEFFNQQSKFF